MKEQRKAKQTGVSDQFKNFVAFLIGSLAIFRVFMSRFTQEPQPISDGVLLLLIIVLVAYLWIRQSHTLHDLGTVQASLVSSQVTTIMALVKAIEAKDQYTFGHSERVARFAVELARKLQLGEDVVAVIKRAALLHDIGKMGISDDILHKKPPLSDEEWRIVKQHPKWSNEILSTLPFMEVESRIALLHHERYDGTGYPLGLKSDEIPIEAFIVAISDGFDAMNSKRPYRAPLSREQVVSEIAKGRATQYSPVVTDAFLALLKDKPELWARST